MSSGIASGQTRALTALRRSLFFVSLPILILYLLLPVYGTEIGASVVEIVVFGHSQPFLTQDSEGQS